MPEKGEGQQEEARARRSLRDESREANRRSRSNTNCVSYSLLYSKFERSHSFGDAVELCEFQYKHTHAHINTLAYDSLILENFRDRSATLPLSPTLCISNTQAALASDNKEASETETETKREK